MPFTWETLPQWMDHIERLPKAVNMMQLVPVTPLVSYVMGGWDQAKSRQPNEKELARMVEILDEAMAVRRQRLGGPAPGSADSRLSAITTDPDGLGSDGGQGLPDSGQGLAQVRSRPHPICAGLGRRRARSRGRSPARYRFRRATGRGQQPPARLQRIVPNSHQPDVFRAQASVVDEYNRKGVALVGHAVTVRLNIRCCFLEEWTFFDNVDPWREALMGSLEERKAKLADPDRRQILKHIYDRSRQPIFAGDIANFVCRKISRDELRSKYQDRTVSDIAKSENKHVVDVLLDVSAADDWKTQWISGVFNSRPEYCKELLSHRTVAGFSDGGAHAKFQTMGIYPTDLLTWLVRDTGTITLEQAHYHLSYMPAWTAGFKDRGAIREGLAADMLIYDLDKLGIEEPESVNDLPPDNDSRLVQRPRGYRWIMVNGQSLSKMARTPRRIPASWCAAPGAASLD